MKKIKAFFTGVYKRLKSKGYYLGVVIIAIPHAYQNFHLLRDLIGENYNAWFFGLGLVAFLVREFTTAPVSEK